MCVYECVYPRYLQLYRYDARWGKWNNGREQEQGTGDRDRDGQNDNGDPEIERCATMGGRGRYLTVVGKVDRTMDSLRGSSGGEDCLQVEQRQIKGPTHGACVCLVGGSFSVRVGRRQEIGDWF